MVGVILGVLLLLLLIGLVVLQGMIEWGGFDFEKFMNKKGQTEPAKTEIKKEEEKKPAKSAVKKSPKTAKTTKTAKTATKKAARGKGKK